MAEEKGIYQPWSHESFMADRRVRRMTPTALKTYMMLLHEAYICTDRPYLPDDDEELKLMAFCETEEEWISVRDTVLGMFEKVEIEGRKLLKNSRLCQDWDKLQGIRANRTEAGRKGGLEKASKCLPNSTKEVSKEVREVSKQEKEVSTPAYADNTISPRDEKPATDDELAEMGEEVMKIEKEIKQICLQSGFQAFGSREAWETLEAAARVHSRAAVVRDFEDWLQDQDAQAMFKSAVGLYSRIVHERLGADPTKVKQITPEVKALTAKLTQLSDSRISFDDRQRKRLVEVLGTYTEAEVISAYRKFLDVTDLEDQYTLKFAARNFAEKVEDLTAAARADAIERAAAEKQREEIRAQLLDEKAKREAEQDAPQEPEEDIFSILNSLPEAKQ